MTELSNFDKCVVAVYAEQNGKIIQCGTGTLFRVVDVSFLITASHVADIAIKHALQLYIADNLNGSEGIPLEGWIHQENNYDIAVWELLPKIVDKLSNRKFLRVHEADRAKTRISKGWFYVHGYPNCWSSAIPEESKNYVKPFTYGTVLYKGDTSTFRDYNPDVHILLSIEAENVNANGEVAELPGKLSGISGCSLWQAYYEGLSSRDWSPDDAKVVAVQTGIYKDGRVVKGTYWFLVLELLRRKYPKLEKPLSIVTPYKRKKFLFRQ